MNAHSVLDHPAFERRFTPAHRELRERARSYFEPSRLGGMAGRPRGHLRKSQWEELGRQGFLGVSLPRRAGGERPRPAGRADPQRGGVAARRPRHLPRPALPDRDHRPLAGDRARRGGARPLSPRDDRRPPGRLRLRHRARRADGLDGGRATAASWWSTPASSTWSTAPTPTSASSPCKLDGEMATVLVEKERPGVRVLKVFDKLGTRAIDSAMIDFDGRSGCRSPISPLKRGVRQLMHWNKVMTTARFLMCADACFLHGCLLERILEYGGAADRRRPRPGELADQPARDRPGRRRPGADAGGPDRPLRAAGEQAQRGGRGRGAEVVLRRPRRRASPPSAPSCRGAPATCGTASSWAPRRRSSASRWRGGSLTTMKAIAGQALAYREELEALG